MESACAATILVVEDHDLLRQFVSQVLRSGGYLVLEAQDGQEALELSRQHQGAIHLLMTDICLPHLEGPELARRLQADRVGLNVMFLSGNKDSEAVAQDQLLTKPFTIQQLLERVKNALQA